MALRYIETHEYEIAQNILNSALEFCSEKCSLVINNKLRSNLGRIFSMSKNHKEALELSYISLTQIKNAPDFVKDYDLKKEYLRELLSAVGRSMNAYLFDEELYENLFRFYKKNTPNYLKNFLKNITYQTMTAIYIPL